MDNEKLFYAIENILERVEKEVNENFNYLKFIGGAVFCGAVVLAFGKSIEMAARGAIAGGIIVTLTGRSTYYWRMKFRRMREERKFQESQKPKDEQKE